jgi:hypothetical protein
VVAVVGLAVATARRRSGRPIAAVEIIGEPLGSILASRD